MSQPSKWWWGLLPLVLLWFVATGVVHKSIVADLRDRATAALGSSIADPAIAVAGRDVSISGMTFSTEDAAKTASTAASVWGVRKAVSDARTPAVATPFDWSATRDGETVSLTGNVPNPSIRDKIVAAAKAAFSGAAIKDDMTYASGAPAGYDIAALFGLEQLGHLTGGGVSLSDTALSLSGNAATQDLYDQVAAGLKALPQGFTLAKSDVVAPAKPAAVPVAVAVPVAAAPAGYAFEATKDAGTLTLTGNYPDEDTHSKIADAVKGLFAGSAIADKLTAATGTPAGFGDAAVAALGALSRLASGAVSLSNTDAKLSGEALYQQAVGSIQESFAAALPSGFTAQPVEISVRAAEPAVDAAGCQTTLNSLLSTATINFETGKAQISSASKGLLDLIVATVGRCPENKTIEVSGNTDSTGDEAANVALSEQRAKSVVAYLQDAGVSPGRLAAFGYGSSRPVASNDTEEGRTKNRRIEFSVK
jgi:OOP family OmpA-OmpF porin